jgi:MSHA biogenesis protein MshG
MPVFTYKARGTRGDAIEGTLEAHAPDAAAAQLIEGGLTPVDIQPLITGTGLSNNLGILFLPKITLIDLIQFSRQMYSMLRAGVPIFSAISGLATTSSNRNLKATLEEVMLSLESGRPLSDSLSQHPDVFSEFYVNLIRVGETSGQLMEIFQQLAYYLEREEKTRKQIKSVLRYPLFVISAILIALTIISIWVIPVFFNIFERFGAELPLQTRILMSFSTFMVENWKWLLFALLVSVTTLKMYVDTDAGCYRWHKLKLRLPLAGKIIYKATLARFSHLFALAQQAGVPLIATLTVVARALNNVYLEERVLSMRAGVERGNSLSLTAANSDIFDPLVLQMLAVGEKSGTINELLTELASYYDREVDYDIDRLSASIEPILTLLIGILVLILALGVFLPMWDLGSAALQRG